MKLIILAAGKGERLWPLTKNTPKPLLSIGEGATLLEEQIDRVAKSGAVNEVIVVTGYLASQIDAKVSTLDHANCRVRTLYNPFYETTNNLVSLWLARHEMLSSDFMITNGDNLFDPDVFRELTDATPEGGIHLSVSSKSAFDDDDMKVSLVDGVVREVRKTIPHEAAEAESPGLSLVRGERSRQLFVDVLDEIVRDPSQLNVFWLEAFNRLYTKGVSVKPWFFVAEGRWQEVDIHPDVTRMEEFLRSAVAPGAG